MYGIGIIGLGVMGARMLAQFHDHPGFRVAAVWDPSDDACANARAVVPGLLSAASAAGVVATEGVDCVYIASPPVTHLDYIAMVLDAGKAVLCEKPLALDVAASRAVVARAETCGARAGVNFPQASSPAVRAVAAMIASGELGTLERLEIDLVFPCWPESWQVAARWLAYREQGGFVREVVSHMAFLARRLLGPLEVVEATFNYPPDGVGAETRAHAVLRAGGLPVLLSGAIAAGESERTDWTLSGSKGACRIHGWYSLAVESSLAWSPVDLGLQPRDAAYRAQLDGLAAMIDGRPNAIASLREGLDVQQCIEDLIVRPDRR